MKNSEPRVSVIVTVFNEEKTIDSLLKSLKNQTYLPAEVVIVDGGSDDATFKKLKSWQKKWSRLKVYYQEGNRAVGRNLAIKKARYRLIAITDAGCLPEKNWLKALVNKQIEAQADVVAGYYRGLAKTPLEEAIIPYVLVMPDKIDPKGFLPATRSMLLTKKAWKKVAGFDESLDSSEDYDFAVRLKQAGLKMAFAKEAVVSWYPRTSLTDFTAMIAEFAFWDAKAGHLRKKVRFLFARYVFFFFLISMLVQTRWLWWGVMFGLTMLAYVVWAVLKNKKYVKKGWWWLPILQFMSDFMVMGGTMLGALDRRKLEATRNSS